MYRSVCGSSPFPELDVVFVSLNWRLLFSDVLSAVTPVSPLISNVMSSVISVRVAKVFNLITLTTSLILPKGSKKSVLTYFVA